MTQICSDLRFRAAAAIPVGPESAFTGIHRADQLEIRRKRIISADTRDVYEMLFQRLPQHFKRSRMVFRKFIEKQNTLMGKADFSRTRFLPATGQRKPCHRVMRRAVRALCH